MRDLTSVALPDDVHDRIAGVLGHSLIYTLPGSVKAVEEYMTEIMQTVEHLVLTLHGLDLHGSTNH